jgi:hypothetical protein
VQGAAATCLRDAATVAAGPGAPLTTALLGTLLPP